jgi:pimeloyl-ACP methyl ester carboxylesterase
VPGIYHQESGTGPTLILIHGFCETSHIWDGFAAKLSSRFRVVCPDLPGFGKSAMPETPFTISDIASSISRWIISNQLNKPVIIGHSLGGYVTLAIANKGEVPLAGFGLFHSTALPDSDEKKASRNKVIEFVSRNGVKPYIETFAPSLFYDKNSRHLAAVSAMMSEASPEALTGYLAAMRDRQDQTVLLARYGRPVLLLAGTGDELIPLEAIEKQAKMLQKGTLITLPETGHMGMLETTEKSAREVAKFANSCQF